MVLLLLISQLETCQFVQVFTLEFQSLLIIDLG